jgi:hypothetical protein
MPVPYSAKCPVPRPASPKSFCKWTLDWDTSSSREVVPPRGPRCPVPPSPVQSRPVQSRSVPSQPSAPTGRDSKAQCRSAGLGSRRPPSTSSKAPSGRDKFMGAHRFRREQNRAPPPWPRTACPSPSLPENPRRAEPVFPRPCKQLRKFPAGIRASERWQILPPYLGLWSKSSAALLRAWIRP